MGPSTKEKHKKLLVLYLKIEAIICVNWFLSVLLRRRVAQAETGPWSLRSVQQPHPGARQRRGHRRTHLQARL